MSESADYSPAPHWKGYDFNSARKNYRDIADRSYGDAVKTGVKAADLIPEKLETQCECPLIIAVDVTGSMSAWPATIFSKLPYLEHEAKEYLGDFEISFAAIGDALASDKYPLQVQKFVKGVALKENLQKLIHEGGGGGGEQESYDLAALYYARNCHTPGAIRKPIMIFIGDEGLYNFIAEDKAETWSRVSLGSEKMSVEKLFEELTEKFDVFIIRKPYNCDNNKPTSSELAIRKQWIDLLGGDHVVSLPDPNRVVDVIFGILAKVTGKLGYFKKELKDRQGKDVDGDKKIDVVLNSLKHITDGKDDKSADKPDKTKSITRRKPGGAKSISLLDD